MIDKLIEDTIVKTADLLERIGIRFFIVGAVARDLNASAVNVTLSKITEDLDFGVCVCNWAEFEKIKALLISNGFKPDERRQHRFKHLTVPVDIVPFGGIESDKRKITWPPKLVSVMNLMGFEETYKASREHSFRSKKVRVATVEGVAVLKVVAWEDRKNQSEKDAEDLEYILTNYAKLGFLADADLYKTHINLLTETYQGDADLTRAELLGTRMADIAGPKVSDFLAAVIKREITDEHQLLIYHMSKTRDEYRTSRVSTILRAMLAGISKTKSNSGSPSKT